MKSKDLEWKLWTLLFDNQICFVIPSMHPKMAQASFTVAPADDQLLSAAPHNHRAYDVSSHMTTIGAKISGFYLVAFNKADAR